MATTRGRGRVVKAGGVGGEADTVRTEPVSRITRPAYVISQGVQMPTQPHSPLAHPLLDLSTVAGWRLVWVGAAVAYLVGFHVTLGRSRVGIGPAR